MIIISNRPKFKALKKELRAGSDYSWTIITKSWMAGL